MGQAEEGGIDWMALEEFKSYAKSLNSFNQEDCKVFYFIFRSQLMNAYGELGMAAQSPIALRLAADNCLDLMCMSRKSGKGEIQFKNVVGWMVAAGMDQEALNMFVYFVERRSSREPLPYLDIHSKDADLDDPDTMTMLLGNIGQKVNHYCPEMHHHIIIPLLKYNKLQQRLMERRKSIVKWKSFMMGTHPEVGSCSPVQKLGGNRKVLEKIQNMVINKGEVKKIKRDRWMITRCLERVQERRREMIDELQRSRSQIQDPEKQSVTPSFVAAWNMSPTYSKILKNFAETGKITDKPWHQPIEGFFQASVDTDPTKTYGDCSEFSLICCKTGTSTHNC